MLEGPLEPGEEHLVTIDAVGFRGESIVEHDECPIFVPGVIPGEKVLIRIRKRYRNHYYADAVRIEEPSPHRVDPPCELFGTCAGCQFQHIAYPHQLELKREMVRAAASVI